MLAATLSRVVLMVRPGEGFTKALEFYTAGLGLHAARVTEEWADLQTTATNNLLQPQHSIFLQVVTSESQVSTGYSPILQFHVDDMDSCIARCIQLGGHLDGPIQYPAHGKMAALRTPDGHMIGIYEPASSTSR
jgi:catechol 2,3-dioxygenase-like lactoylglutathione lyase family enzyme